MPSRVKTALKALIQLGPGALALYALYQTGLRTGHYRRVEERGKRKEERGGRVETGGKWKVAGGEERGEGLFTLPGREAIRRVMRAEGARRVVDEAEEIAAGKVHLFGAEAVPLRLTFDRPLHHWTEYELNPELLRELIAPISDIKFVWEPARFGWAFTLGRAYHLSGDERYAETFWRHFEEFAAGNPAYCGPHWMNGQEVALRLMALAWAGEVLAGARGSTPAREGRLREAIATHAARIPHTLIYARSQNNNHLVSEAAGLYTAGLALGHAGWRETGWRWLNRALQHQISGYGEYIQHSANYHRLMLQAALWVHAIKDEEWPRASSQALERATHYLFSMLDPGSGRVPNLGANDGSLILPLSATVFQDYRPTVQAAARAFLGIQMGPGPWDEMPLWLGLPEAGRTHEPEQYLGDHPRGEHSWAVLRASSFKSRLGHMDQLHLDLWWRGMNIAQDAGTYLYNAEPPWDNPLTATRVHNTVTVDGREQMTRGGRFLTLDWFPAFSKISIEGEGDLLQRVMAHHEGYPGVRHERTVSVHAGDRWVVEDRLIARGGHTYRLHWLLEEGDEDQEKWRIENRDSRFEASGHGLERGKRKEERGWKVEEGEGGGEVRIQQGEGWIAVRMRAGPAAEASLSVVRAGELVYGKREMLPYEGWVSPTYGVKIPALSVMLEVHARRPVTLTTEFLFPHP